MIVGRAHFGVNAHFENYDMAPGGTFARSLDLLGATAVRWPGGSVTEHMTRADVLALFDHSSGTDGRSSIHEAGALLKARGRTMQIVVPTRHITPADVAVLAPRFIAFARNNLGLVDVFEIGNEYWGAGQTPAQYAAKAVPWLRAMRGIGIPLIVQAPEYWGQTPPGAIWDALPADVRPAVAGISQHFYPATIAHAESRDICFNELARAAPADRERFVSEWNMFSKAANPVTGLPAATGIVAAFHQMIRRGVDRASVWSVNYQSQAMKLTGIAPNGGVFITPAGCAFRLLRDETPGRAPSSRHLIRHPSCKSFSFANTAGAVTFAANMGAGGFVECDLPALIANASDCTIRARKIVASDNPHTGAVEAETSPNVVGSTPDTAPPNFAGRRRAWLKPGEVWVVSIRAKSGDLKWR